MMNYQQQNSQMTLREGLAEFRANLKEVAGGEGSEAQNLFNAHDAVHVVFGCGSDLTHETLADVWTLCASDVKLRNYLGYLNVNEALELVKKESPSAMLLGVIKALPSAAKVWLRSRKMTKPWPFQGSAEFLDKPLCEIRKRFNIEVVA